MDKTIDALALDIHISQVLTMKGESKKSKFPNDFRCSQNLICNAFVTKAVT